MGDDAGARARVCLGAIAGAFGVRGEARVKTFTEDPAAIGDYGALETEDRTRRFELTVTRRLKGDMVAARLSGAADREAVEALRGTRLYAERAALPAVEDEDEFYHADLIGLRVVAPDGRPLGVVRAVQDFGAGDLLEFGAPGAKRTELVPFTRDVVPSIDLANAVVVVDAPPDQESEPEMDGARRASGGDAPGDPGDAASAPTGAADDR